MYDEIRESDCELPNTIFAVMSISLEIMEYLEKNKRISVLIRVGWHSVFLLKKMPCV
jgi:hypothetical protein